MDYGESESVVLVEELEADYLLIDDRKARKIAEYFGIDCIGSIGLLLRAYELNLIDSLRPIFTIWLENNRHFNLTLLNGILSRVGEDEIR